MKENGSAETLTLRKRAEKVLAPFIRVLSHAAPRERAVEELRFAKALVPAQAGREDIGPTWLGRLRSQFAQTGRRDAEAAGRRAGSGGASTGRAGPWAFGPPTCRRGM